LTASAEHLKRLRENISEMSNIPDTAIGKQLSISNTSASALAITFMPMYETMEFKRTTYGAGLLRANTFSLKLAFLIGKLSPNLIIKNALARWGEDFKEASPLVKERNYPFSTKIKNGFNYDSLSAFYNNEIPHEIFQTSITWFAPLPRDENLIADLGATMVGAKIWTRDYVRKLQGMSERESQRMERNIIDEVTKIGETTVTNENVNRIKGNPDVKGENESKRRQKKSENI
jgi:hypothetical protein